MNTSKFIFRKLCTLALIAAFAPFTACSANKEASKTVSDSTRTIIVGNFSKISNHTAAIIHFAYGNKSVKVKDDTNTLAVEVKNGVLQISRNKDFDGKNSSGSTKGAELWITNPKLADIENSAVIDFTSDNLKDDDINIRNYGSANWQINKIDTESLNFSNYGVSKLICKNISSNKAGFDNYGVLTISTTVNCKNLQFLNNGNCSGTISTECSDANITNAGVLKLQSDIKAKNSQIYSTGIYDSATNVNGDKLTYTNMGKGNPNIDFNGDEIVITNQGIADNVITVNCKKLKALNSGLAKMIIKGTADDTQFDSTGKANIDTSELNKF